ncbi:MAG TPA: thiamine biosynthesis protein ThiF [Nitrospiraceae bacterium]|nr:thiamine biosynthesis protein ThiF [Nitrospiraceae bacterium]
MTTGRPADQLIQQLSKAWVSPGKQKRLVIDLQSVRYIASKTKTASREIEITCLEHGIVPARYLRNIGTIGIEGQIKLLRSTVVVCGVGGLGGTITELLARQGIGHLVIIDKGRFVENNLNRQIIATEEDLGKSKVKTAVDRVKKINSAVVVTPINKTINSQTITRFIRNAGVVLDGLDNFMTRRIVANACNKLKIPFVHGAIAGFCGQMMTILPGDKGFKAICDISGTESGCGVETLTGNPAATPAIIAAWEVQEAIKIITGVGDLIRDRLIFLDFLDNTVDQISLSHRVDQITPFQGKKVSPNFDSKEEGPKKKAKLKATLI